MPADELKTYEQYWVPGSTALPELYLNPPYFQFIIDFAKRKRRESTVSIGSSSASEASASSESAPRPFSTVSRQEFDISSNITSYFTPIGNRQGNIASMFAKIEDTQQEFEKDIVCMLISCNLSLNLCDNHEFKACIRKWTNREAPSTSKVTKTIVPRLSQTINSHIKDVIKGAKWITIVSDSWTNLRNESITNYIAHCPMPVFFRATHNKQKIKDCEMEKLFYDNFQK
jgi:hypothetical protein